VTPNPPPPPDVSPAMHSLTADGPTGFPPPMTAPRSLPAPADDVLAARPASDFDALFAAHYERLVRALTLVAGDVEAAADAVQEAFVKAHLRWRTISRSRDPELRGTSRARPIRVGSVLVGGPRPIVIAGPCAVESAEQTITSSAA